MKDTQDWNNAKAGSENEQCHSYKHCHTADECQQQVTVSYQGPTSCESCYNHNQTHPRAKESPN